MSIVTKTGDNGTTGLMYNRRVSKCHPRVEAYGTVDELNSALGMARATATDDFIATHVLALQKELVIVMGELATAQEDLQRYASDGFTVVTADMSGRLEKLIREIENQNITYRGWATPGDNPCAAALDVARTACRRAERRVCALEGSNQLKNLEILIYLNRLSDLLWLMARWSETKNLC
jgi:cob(I)alamin adenosyltransferase